MSKTTTLIDDIRNFMDTDPYIEEVRGQADEKYDPIIIFIKDHKRGELIEVGAASLRSKVHMVQFSLVVCDVNAACYQLGMVHGIRAQQGLNVWCGAVFGADGHIEVPLTAPHDEQEMFLLDELPNLETTTEEKEDE